MGAKRMNTDFTVTPTRYWTRLDDGRVQCDVCPRRCRLHEGQRGLCFVRGRERDGIELYTYGRSSGFCVDPIEKKPLNHFLPGSSVLSFGTAGCNLACKFCQNWDMSKSREMDTLADSASPSELAEVLPELGREQITRDGHNRGFGFAGGTGGNGATARLRQRGLHLQRPDRLHGVRHRRRGSLP